MASKKDSSQREGVKVVCRVRPQNKIEIAAGGKVCVQLTQNAIDVNSEEGHHNFSFDRVFGPDTTQIEVFNYAAAPMIADVLNGYNATIFAYGQTSSGKTHTMEGTGIHDEVGKGIIPRTVEALFAGVSEADEHIEFCFKASYVEIYCEKIRDLLDNHRVKTNLQVREDKNKGVYIAGVTEEYVTSEEELLAVMAAGAMNRAVAATGMNEGSSRSHSVFSITVTQRDTSNASTKSGKLVLVDLAGSETIKKSNVSGQQLEEAKTINKSLSALGQVIYALTDEKSTHVPYRDSKLTRILQDSLGGNSKTSLIVACSPSSYNSAETVSTLRFGTRAKSITNKVTVNRTRSVEELEALLAKAEREIELKNGQILSLSAQLEEYVANPEAAKSASTRTAVNTTSDVDDGETVDNEADGNAKRFITKSMSIAEQEAVMIEKLQATIINLTLELDEEREETRRMATENEKLSILLSQKDNVLIEAGELMQDAQVLYENAKNRCEQLAREKADLFGELESFKVQRVEDVARLKYEMQEMELSLETQRADNERLKVEIAQMSGDDVSVGDGANRKVTTTSSKEARAREALNSVDHMGDDHSQGSIPQKSPKSNEKDRFEDHPTASPKTFDIGGRSEASNLAGQKLVLLVEQYALSTQAAEAIFNWSKEWALEEENWFNIALDKYAAYEKSINDLTKRVKDLESQRSRLEKDLQIRTEKMELDQFSGTSNSSLAEVIGERERSQYKMLQQRLEQLVAVHRQLLRKFASLELENGELRKKLVLRDERIKQLEQNAKGLTGNLRQQAERHVAELTNLREQIQEMKTEHQQRMDNKQENSTPVYHHRADGPRVIRGGAGANASVEGTTSTKSVRGGGSTKKANPGGPGSPTSNLPETTVAQKKDSITSGIFARFLNAAIPGAK